MPRSNQTNGSKGNAGQQNGGGRNQSNKRNDSSSNSNPSQQSKAILKIKRAKRSEHQVKATFEDDEGDAVKEMVQTFRDGDPKELLIELEKELLKLGDRYELFNDGKWKKLCRLGGRALEGRCADVWAEVVETVRNHGAGDETAQRNKFRKLIQKMNARYLGEDAYDDQRDAMEKGELKYEGHDHEQLAERLFQINKDLELFHEVADQFSIRDMARKIIPRNLKTAARLKYNDKDGPDLTSKEDIIKLCRKITKNLNEEKEVERERKQKEKMRNEQKSNSSSSKNSSNNGNGNSDKEKKESAPCRIHDEAHKWKDCPNNFRNKANGGNKQANPPSESNKKGKGEVKSTESEKGSPSRSPIVRFKDVEFESDDESVDSEASKGELMEIAAEVAKSKGLHPITILTLLNGSQERIACKALLDQCCTDNGLITWELAEMLNVPATSGEPRTFVTAAGTFTTTDVLKISNAMLPCLSNNRTFTIELMIIPKECGGDMNYGAIIGQESMRLLDLDTSVRDNTISWGDERIAMVPRDYWTAERIQQQRSRLNRHPAAMKSKSKPIEDEVSLAEALAPTNYTKANLPQTVEKCKNLTPKQKSKLLTVLLKHEELFQGQRGNWTGPPVSIELLNGADPVWAKPYPVPLKNREVFKDEIYRQCSIGALRELSAEEVEERVWASPCFGIPKKNGSIRLVIDFRQLNTVLKRKEYPLPTIDEIFQDIGGFTFASVVDLNMGYLSIPLTEETKKILTIVTMFGFFECCVLPMGIKPATDIFQSRMVGIFQQMGKNKPNPYIDDIFHGKGNTFERHLTILDEMFQLLEDHGMQVNLEKSKLCATEVEFLGFCVKQTGFQPTRKRVEAILKLDRPHNVKKVRAFLGVINFIKNHIPNRAELLAPITKLTKKDQPFVWENEQQQAFNKTKAAIANSILCTYPNPNKPFIIYPDASQKYAMGAILVQENNGIEQVISTFSRKFNDAQLKYTVGEQELLAAHEACRFFHNIIYGCEILIRCDHKNITNAETKHANLRILRQRITLDQDYGAKFEHFAGELNTGADGLSRLQMTDDIPPTSLQEIYAINELDRNNNIDFPLTMRIIKEEQEKDSRLTKKLGDKKLKPHFGTLSFGDFQVHTYNGKIWVPPNLQPRIIEWYHENLRHPGVTRTINSINQNFNWKGMRAQVEDHVKSCDQCQRHKITGKLNYGHLPLVSALRDKEPFEKVHVDCAGPWTVRLNDNTPTKEIEYKIHILSMVDAATNWCELALIPTANSKSCAIQFDTNWLCRYPRPTEVGHDNGNEFMGEEFQELLISYDIKSKPTTIKNPTAQSLIERLHLTLGDQLRTSIYSIDHWHEDVDHLLQACAWAIRTTTPSNGPYNPSQLAFGMDMIFRQKIKVDWQLLKEQRRIQAIANNKKENKHRIHHDYKVGDFVLIIDKSYERAKKSKLSSPTQGPYEIIKIYSNGNVRIRRNNYDEDISIRRLRPYYNSQNQTTAQN